jgi:hypothetical protein
MFPYRRNGGKKRGKGNGPGPHHPRDNRRIPGSAGDILPLLQPTTKALAQMLAGNTRMSGQPVHARNILVQAQRLVDERAVDRLPPAQREEFFEQLARLKLTLADADEAGLLQDAQPAAPVRPMERIGTDRLLDVARRLAMGTATPTPAPALTPIAMADEDVDEELDGTTAEPFAPGPSIAGPAPSASNGHGERLRLKMGGGPDAPAPERARSRLRMPTLRPTARSTGD